MSAGAACPFRYPSPEVIEDPFGFYAWLRDAAPVHRLDDGSYLVSRYADVVAVVRDPALFSNRIGPQNEAILGGPRVGGDDSGPWAIPFEDPPRHRPQRRLSMSLVARDRMRWYAPVILRNADELIDGFHARGRADLRAEFAAILPRRVMMDAFGFPRADEPDFVRWASGQGPVGSRLASPAARAQEQRNRIELAGYFEAKIRARGAQPGDDYVSEFVAAHVASDGELDMPYALAELTNLFAAGNGTTAHLIASAMLLLLEHPDQLARVRADRPLLRTVVEEVVRLESPIQWNQRITTADAEIAGVTVPAGSVVLIAWAAANRDPAAFADPDAFSLDRPELQKRHLAWGQGPHRCLGVPLARLEGELAIGRLLDRLDGLRLAADAPPPRHIPNLNQRAPEAVHVTFGAA